MTWMTWAGNDENPRAADCRAVQHRRVVDAGAEAAGAQRWISLAGAVLLLASTVVVFARVNASGIQVLQVSGWPAPFGITLVADLLAGLLVVAVGVVASRSRSLHSQASIQGERHSVTTR